MEDIAAATTTSTDGELDAIIIGAGFSGLYQLHLLRDRLGLKATVVERAGDVGGTWWWLEVQAGLIHLLAQRLANRNSSATHVDVCLDRASRCVLSIDVHPLVDGISEVDWGEQIQAATVNRFANQSMPFVGELESAIPVAADGYCL